MLKHFISFLIISFLFVCLYSAQAALSGEQTGKILDRFKGRQQELLFETPLGNFDSEDLKIFDLSKKANIYGNIGTKLSGERGTIEDKHVHELGKILTLKDSLDMLNKDIEEAEVMVDKINGNVIEIKRNIENNKKVLEFTRKKIKENREILLEYMTYLYQKGNNVYSQTEFDNFKTILLNNGNISDVIDDLYYKGVIQLTGKRLVDHHKGLMMTLYSKKLELEKDEKTLKKYRKLAIIDQKVLNDKKAFQERLLTVSEGKQQLYEKFIKNKLDVEKKVKLQAFKEKVRFQKIQKDLLKKYNCTFVDAGSVNIDEVPMSAKCLEINKVLYAEEKLQKKSAVTKNFFEWPVSPTLGITSFYKGKNYRRLFGSDHEAIDVVARQGTPIRAPADGYVIYVNEPAVGEYSFLAIKHAEGYVTVYGHLSAIKVQPFDYVRKNQVFAESGGEYGTKGAGLITTGAHLHFEVFQDEKSIDPLSVLDISYANYGNLPSKYQVKFQSDFRLRKGYDYAKAKKSNRVFRLEGNSEEERQHYLIRNYADARFQNWNLWVNESIEANIDPTFTMCIGLAETGLGRHIKKGSGYNVGNVGNNDSGDIRHFQSAQEGIYAMVRTLNNQYLGKYNQIDQLSRYGNKDGIIYASSPDHWHNNIITCMSSIKGYEVMDDYNFRLVQ
ncbi:MAG: peptidoglycan DD-metalloendopeptidase family protein [Candidatus Gracilibacteria bacterium]|nr:peptidoglycan DD-metalloendopeptidase family protein [Candidatus Gracilibacteria bacterium]